jgi:heme-degrading monooxygenase HmoA
LVRLYRYAFIMLPFICIQFQGGGIPVAFFTLRHTVAEFDKWQAGFIAGEGDRRAAGCTKEHVFRGTENPNDVLVVTEWGSADQAKAFVASPQLREAMAGLVVGKPQVFQMEAL